MSTNAEPKSKKKKNTNIFTYFKKIELTYCLIELLTQPKLKTESDEFPPEEIVTHLIDLFFQHINSVFPFVHRARLKKSIQDGNVSKPLIWGVMAIAARYDKAFQTKRKGIYD